ncbi:hypothetical protein HO133_009701 [Letharia lupina]|uniref:Nuclear localization protein NPL6 n=1 Tax=Letharia lupina TaxID=560253 RepID=A0A8H6CM07_9LECA|nr:uncharacterized protein HO133_009701 [Letharia lupina]KAF6225701.1 hypothetical protein HO133_009701 [Letharia lupina]
MVRTSRAQAARAAKRITTPQAPDISDEEMVDGPVSAAASIQENGSENEEENEIEVEEEDGQATPAAESDAGSRLSTPNPGRILKPRKRGRPARRGSSRRGAADELESRDTGSEAGTPRKRGGWRGRGFGGGRWGKPRGGPSHVTQVPLDKEGNMAPVKDDEVQLPPDSEGEEKVDVNGHLKGGREYRVRTFSIEGKGDRLYMLSTEPARCIGFRDSYLFFQKHKQLYKIILAEEAKKDLIERGLIPHSYKGRAIGVVTARSVFREFGARIIIGGKKITDDYQAATARANGDVEGELANPDDDLPGGGEEYDKNKFVAWHGASAVYHTGAPSVPIVNGKAVEGKKRKIIVTGANWMFEHAREASRFNSSLAAQRRHNLNGVYDVHTNVMQYPKIMQPTHARWEQVLPTSPTPRTSQTAADQINGHLSDGREPAANTIFPDIAPVFTRNFMISDTYFETPPASVLGYPGPDEETELTRLPEHLLAELPEGCRQAFVEARAVEKAWKERWGTDKDDGARAQLRITYNT